MRSRVIYVAFTAFLLFPLLTSADGMAFKTMKGNAYYAGGNLNITESVPGDIVAAGGNVIIAGSAEDDVLAAGGTVHMSGKVRGDARIAGGDVTIGSEIKGEAMVAGGQVRLLPESNISNDLFAAGGNVSIDGNIEGGAKITGGTVTINGTINKDVKISAGRIIIGKNAVINGDLYYESPHEAQIEQGAIIKGQKTFKMKEYKLPAKKLAGIFWLWWFVKLLAVLAAALVLHISLRKKIEEFTAFALSRFGAELLVGFVLLVVIPAALGILFITIIGWLLGLIGLFFYITFILLSSALGAIVFSGLIGRYLFKKEQYVTRPIILLGVLIYEIVGLLPVLGWLMKFVFILSAFGAFSHLVYTSFKKA